MAQVSFIIEPVHEISNNVACATSKGSDQPAHKRSLIRALQVAWVFYECLATDWHNLEFQSVKKEAAEARPSLLMSKWHITGNLMHWLNI